LPGACDPLSSKEPEAPAPCDLRSGVYNYRILSDLFLILQFIHEA